MKKTLKTLALVSVMPLVFTACASTGSTSSKSSGKSKSNSGKLDVDKEVYYKYSSPNSGDIASWGGLNVHDPKLWQDDDGTYYCYSTDAAIGGAGQKGIQVRTSKDLVHWSMQSQSAIQGNWDRDWLKWVDFNRSTASTWAPTIIKQNGLYYMMHGIITDSRNRGYPDAAITLTVSKSPLGPFYPIAQAADKDADIKAIFKKLGVSYKQSTVVRYTYYDRSYDEDDPSIADIYCNNNAMYDTHTAEEGETSSMSLGFGCIDPEFVTDVATGQLKEYVVAGKRTCYALTYGSWKGGIALMFVDKTSLKPVNKEGKEVDLSADTEAGAFGICIAGGYGAAYEGAQVIFNSDNGYYYCFVSMGNLENEYRVGVGRSKNIEGPYLDASGKSMYLDTMHSQDYHAIGSKIVGANELKGECSWRCPGGQSIMRSQDGKILFAHHTRTNFMQGYYFFLQVHQMFFTKDGWPVINENEYYNDYDGSDEKLGGLTVADMAGTYDTILTVRDSLIGNFTPKYDTNPAQVCLADAKPTPSKELVLNEDGSIGGKEYSGTWTLDEVTGAFEIKLKTAKGKDIGTFTGYALKAVDWARRNTKTFRTVTFTTIDGSSSGEYFWGNRR